MWQKQSQMNRCKTHLAWKVGKITHSFKKMITFWMLAENNCPFLVCWLSCNKPECFLKIKKSRLLRWNYKISCFGLKSMDWYLILPCNLINYFSCSSALMLCHYSSISGPQPWPYDHVLCICNSNHYVHVQEYEW